MTPKRKEGGVIYVAACLACQDELALGWLPTQVDVPRIRPESSRRPWPSRRPDGVFTEPVTCRCGQVRLALVEEAERARVAVYWTGAQEPTLRIVPQYGSMRDLATEGA